jgi:hypothetical protein
MSQADYVTVFQFAAKSLDDLGQHDQADVLREAATKFRTDLRQMTETSSRRKIVNERLKAEIKLLYDEAENNQATSDHLEDLCNQQHARVDVLEKVLRGLRVDDDKTFLVDSGPEIDSTSCVLCGAEEEYHPRQEPSYTITHKPDCPVLAARAILKLSSEKE